MRKFDIKRSTFLCKDSAMGSIANIVGLLRLGQALSDRIKNPDESKFEIKLQMRIHNKKRPIGWILE